MMLIINESKPEIDISSETIKWKMRAEVIGITVMMIPTALNIMALIIIEIREIYFSFMITAPHIIILS